MYSRVAQRLTLRTAIALTVCIALLPVPGLSLLMSGAAQGPTQAEGQRGKPRPGKPEGVWPDLDEVKRESQIVREAPPPIPSTIRSGKNSGKPWDGRRVGDRVPPDPNGTERGSAGSELNSKTIEQTSSENSCYYIVMIVYHGGDDHDGRSQRVARAGAVALNARRRPDEAKRRADSCQAVFGRDPALSG